MKYTWYIPYAHILLAMYTTVVKKTPDTWYIPVGIRNNNVPLRRPTIDDAHAFFAQCKCLRSTLYPGLDLDP